MDGVFVKHTSMLSSEISSLSRMALLLEVLLFAFIV